MKRECKVDDATRRFIAAKLMEAGFGDLMAEKLAADAMIPETRRPSNAEIADLSEPTRH